MAIFISAGHNSKASVKPDPGAVNKQGIKEGDLAIEFRDKVVKHLKCLGVEHISVDTNEETLAQYLQRIQTGSGSVVLEFHFDASDNATASGTTALVGTDADRLDKAFAQELANATSEILCIKNRGVKDESESHRGRLGLMRESGIVSLLEIGFISNPGDLAAYEARKDVLAIKIADIVKKYEDMI